MNQIKILATESVVRDRFEQERHQFFKQIEDYWVVERLQTYSLTERDGYWKQVLMFCFNELPEWRFKLVCLYHQQASFYFWGDHRLLWNEHDPKESLIFYEWGENGVEVEPLLRQLQRIQNHPLESFGESFSPTAKLPLPKIKHIYEEMTQDHQFEKRLARYLQKQGFDALKQFAKHHPHVKSVGIKRLNPTQRFKCFQVKVLVESTLSDEAAQSLAFSIETLFDTLTYQKQFLQFQLAGIYDRPSAMTDCQTIFSSNTI